MSARPRPSSPIVIDADNAYARGGVSPTMPTDEISKRLREQHKKLEADAKRSGGDKELTARIADLNALIDRIGDPRRRAEYDASHPENDLLTVQTPRRDAVAGPGARAALVTAWLLEETGGEALLPHPRSLALWCPRVPLDALLGELAPYIDGGDPRPRTTTGKVEDG